MIESTLNFSFIDRSVFFIKLMFFCVVLIFLILIKFILGLFNSYISGHVVKLFHKLVLWLININVEKEGEVSKNPKGILFVSNHISYIDIPVLGSLLPLRFVAKSEVKAWPILGKLAKIGNTIFIERLKINYVIFINLYDLFGNRISIHSYF